MAIMVPKFKNGKVAALADDCGIIVDSENTYFSSKEIEFLIDKLIDEMISIVSKPYAEYPIEEMKSWKSSNMV